MTDKQVKLWMDKRRRAYETGKLPLWKIRMIESISGWEWRVTPGPLTARAKHEDRILSLAIARKPE